MTGTQVFTRGRRIGTVAAAVAAIAIGCETRRPEPLAPVSEVAIRDGRALPVKVPASSADSVKASLSEGLKRTVAEAALTGDPAQPVLLVRDNAGGTVFASRVDPREALAALAPGDIESVEVFKRRDLLPEGAKNGLIVVTLKAGTNWKVARD